jgi:phosphoglycerate dehydrogenase-like enzyme
MADKILITPRSFGQTNPSLFTMLETAGFDLIRNETGGILNKQQIMEMVAPCSGVILGIDPFDADVIAAAPRLRAISKYGVGVDNIDMSVAAERGIKVSRTIGANAEAVADYAVALMLALSRKLLVIDAQCRKADWSKVTTIDFNHMTLGLFGLGAIGKNVAQRAKAFSMRVMAYDIAWDAEYAEKQGIEYTDPETIFRNADFISLHLPLLPTTENFIGDKEIALMKPTAILINTARGGLVDETALLKALKENRIFGAGIDAFLYEPPKERDWFSLPNVILGSHCAASTTGAAENMGRIAVMNILHDLA